MNVRRCASWLPLLAASLLAAACSSTDARSSGPEDEADASSADATTESDGGTRELDASSESADAGPDAAVRTCSDDGVCHTALPPSSWLSDVWGDGTGVLWAVGAVDKQLPGASGLLLRWDGKAWASQTIAAKRLSAIWGSGPTDVWIGGSDGLFHGTGTSSASLTWTKVLSDPITSIWGSSANDVWATSSANRFVFDGKVLHFTGGAAGWEVDPISSRPVAFRKVWGTSGDVWLGGNEDGGCSDVNRCNYGARAIALHRRPDGAGGFTWSEDDAPDFGGTPFWGSDFTGAASTTPQNVWLLGSDGFLDAHFNGTPKIDGSFDWQKGTFGTCHAQLQCEGIQFTRAVWGTSANDVYLGGDSGQLRHWNGTTMTLMKVSIDVLPNVASITAMWGSSKDGLWIVGDQIALHKATP